MAREIFSWSPHPAAFKRHMLYPLFFGICGGTLFLPSSPRSLMSRRKRVKKKKKKSRITMILLHLLFLRKLFKHNPLCHSRIPSQVLCPFNSFLHSFSQCLQHAYYPQVPSEATLERNAYRIYLLTQISTYPECTTLVLYPLLQPQAVSTSHNTAHLPQSWCYLGAGNSFCTALGSQGNGRSLRAWPPPTVLCITGNSSSESGRCSKRQCGVKNSPPAAAPGFAWHLESILFLLYLHVRLPIPRR